MADPNEYAPHGFVSRFGPLAIPDTAEVLEYMTAVLEQIAENQRAALKQNAEFLAQLLARLGDQTGPDREDC